LHYTCPMYVHSATIIIFSLIYQKNVGPFTSHGFFGYFVFHERVLRIAVTAIDFPGVASTLSAIGTARTVSRLRSLRWRNRNEKWLFSLVNFFKRASYSSRKFFSRFLAKAADVFYWTGPRSGRFQIDLFCGS